MAPRPKPKFQWTIENMQKAIAAVKEGTMNVYKASKQYKIPYSTLMLKISKKNEPLRKR